MEFDNLTSRMAFKKGGKIAVPSFLLCFPFAALEAFPNLVVQKFSCSAIGSFFSPGLIILYIAVLMLLIGISLVVRNFENRLSLYIRSLTSTYCELAFGLCFSMLGAFFALSIWYVKTKNYGMFDSIPFLIGFTLFSMSWFGINKLSMSISSDVDQSTSQYVRWFKTGLGCYLIFVSFAFIYFMQISFVVSVKC
ncbi:hypothetical protein RGL59_004782 [Vibrio parahaemolyticus]|uniref:hypothetical protein n=1 Tax=Vibrio parahaemolyticus TaxID=670 RepID=UPI002360664B|nr:hypothetical protein [Vibrio parahaemolyticus]ELA8118550.1 hypothetical protein [Vibrio parahaemolyticus]